MANKRKQKKKATSESLKVAVENISCEIDYEKLAEAIVKAQEISKSQEKNIHKDKKSAWQKSIGMKDVTDGKMSFHNLKCILIFVLSFGFNKKLQQKYESDSIIFGLSQTALSLMYKMIQLIGYIITLIIAIKGFYSIFHSKEYLNGGLTLLYSLLTYFLSQVFNIASYESYNIEDKNYLMSVLSATTCLLSFIVAAISMIFTILSFFSAVGGG